MSDRIRSSLEWVLQQLIDVDATAVIGAGPHERTETRTAQRNGRRPRLLSTPAGDVELEIPSWGRVRSSRRCWNGAGGSTGRCSRW